MGKIKIIRQANLSKHLCLCLNPQAFLGFNGRMQTKAPTPAWLGFTGILIYNQYAFFILHLYACRGTCIVYISLVMNTGNQCLF